MFTWLKKNRKDAQSAKDDFDLVKDLVRSVMGRDFDTSGLTLKSRLDELGFDSVRYIDLMLHLEDIVQVDIEVIAERVDLSTLRTLADVCRLVAELRVTSQKN